MDFNVNELKEKLVGMTKTAAEKSGDLVESTKLAFQISSKEEEISKRFRAIGEMVYSAYLDQNADVDLETFCKEIDQFKTEIDQLKARRAELRQEKVCPHCGRTLKEQDQFCSYCGEKL